MSPHLEAAPSMFAREQAPYTAAAALLMSLQPILVTNSKNNLGGFNYSVPSSTMLSEALKLVISAVLLLASCASGQVKSVLTEDSLCEFFSYLLPAAIYFVNNNCIFFILQAVDPTTFQLLSQMKTIFTGLLFRIFLKRRLTAVQYLALVTLACGTACSQLPSGRAHRGGAQAAAPLVGGLLSVVSSLLSALGGIYNERLLNRRPSASIHWQNIQMYVWGVGFNALGAWMKDGEGIVANGPLAGFDSAAWAVVICNALNGLAISAVCTRTRHACTCTRRIHMHAPAGAPRASCHTPHAKCTCGMHVCVGAQVRGQHRARVRARHRDDAHHGRVDTALQRAGDAAARVSGSPRRDLDAAVQPAAFDAAARGRRDSRALIAHHNLYRVRNAPRAPSTSSRSRAGVRTTHAAHGRVPHL